MTDRAISVSKLAAIASFLIGCSSDSGLRPFTSDGCSLFPDRSLLTADDWCSCCFEHDIAYWRGGTSQERQTADLIFKNCVIEKTQNEALATLMYEGVQAGGSPYFYSWYRWGYGWDYDRKYQALTASEVELAAKLLADYFSSEQQPVCANGS